MNFLKYVSNIFVTTLFDDQNFDPPPTYNVEETGNPPNKHSAENMHERILCSLFFMTPI